MNGVLVAMTIVFAALAVGGGVALFLYARHRSSGSSRSAIDAIERARASLSQELRGGDSALHVAVTQTVGTLGGQLGLQASESRREQSEALADHRRLMVEMRVHQTEELSAAQAELRDRLDTLRQAEAETLSTFGAQVEKVLTDARQEQNQVLVPNDPRFENGVVLLNRQFAPFVELREYWKQSYADHLADEVQKSIEDVYGEVMIARVAHSEELRSDPRWGGARVDSDLRSPVALTMAALGLIAEDQLISSRLKARVGAKTKSEAA